MNQRDKEIPAIEGKLLDYGIGPVAADACLETWFKAGIRRVATHPFLLRELKPETWPEIQFTGMVDFPGGGSTLANKRMNLLECLKTGAKAAAVVLTPGYLAEQVETAIDEEMSALLTTAPELEVRFAVDFASLDNRALTLLMRLLRENPPSAVVACRRDPGWEGSPDRIHPLKAKLPRKIRLVAEGDWTSRERAGEVLRAGADLLLTPRPELLAGPPAP